MNHAFTPEVGQLVELLPENEYWDNLLAKGYKSRETEGYLQVGKVYTITHILHNCIDIKCIDIKNEVDCGTWAVGRFKLAQPKGELTYFVVALEEHNLSFGVAINKAKKNTNEFGTTFLVVDSNGIIVGTTSQVARVEYTPIVKK